jgi:hypothetical protein
MNTVIYNTETGNILALVYPEQDLQVVRSNWPNTPQATLQVPDDFQLLNAIKRVQYRVDTVTRQLIPA